MTRTPIIAGNWKMNLDAAGARQLATEVVSGASAIAKVEAILCPPFPYLSLVAEAVSGSGVKLGAQNLHWEEKGAFTGEVSAAMVRDFAGHVIIGHSERRALFGESDAIVNQKLDAALRAGLIAILCVGETGDEREAGKTLEVLAHQTQMALRDLDVPTTTIVAYEPVWAIGTSKAATPADAADAISFIRGQLGAALGLETAAELRILYGGSATAANIAEFVSHEDIDGGLVGGASLKPESFLEMLEAVSALQ